MNNKVLKYVGMGFGGYLVFAVGVMTLYEEDPDQMHWEDRQAYNMKFINKLSIDQDVQKNYIIESLGSPDITEAKQVDGETVQVMFYRTNHKKSDGITTKDECTPLLFKNGRLIAWGEGVYEQFESF